LAYVAALAVTGNVHDVDAVAAWTLLFTLAGWGLVGVPIVWFVDPRHQVFQAWWGPLVGAAVAFLTFLALVGWWLAPGTQAFNFFAGFAAITGGVAWRTYAFLGRVRRGEALDSQPER
jgi:CHASE2 domain-containing sensor protein